MAWLGFIWLLLLLASAAWLAASAIAALLQRLCVSGQLPPITRRRRLWLIAALPGVLPLTVVGAALVLAAGQKLGWIHDHCLHHGPGHPHLCLEHLPQFLFSYPKALLAATIFSLALLLLARFGGRQQRQARQLESLKAFSHGRQRLRIVDDANVFAFAAGLRHSAVFLSRGLLQRLQPRDRRIVLAHEIAHLRQGDLWKTLLFEFLLLLHEPFTTRKLRRDWHQAIEEMADDQVARRFGAVPVAAALVAVGKASLRPAPVASVSGADSVRRIRRLLEDQTASAQSGFAALYLTGVIATGVAVFATHHQIETLLGLLT